MDEKERLPGYREATDSKLLDSMMMDISGAAILERSLRFRTQRKLQNQLISELNEDAAGIASAIESEVNIQYPGLAVSVKLEFSKGSISWEGIVFVTDILARVSGNIQFVEYLSKTIKFALDRRVRSRIEKKAPVRTLATRVTPRPPPTTPVPRTPWLWWCAGVEPRILRLYSTENTKYQGVGGAVLTTGVLAFFSGSYAIYTIFEGLPGAVPLAILLGTIWALAIFNLDRYIVSTIRKPYPPRRGLRGSLHTIVPIIPRLVLATIIGVTVAKPLELRLFDNRLASRVAIAHDQEVYAKQESLRKLSAEKTRAIDEDLVRMRGTLQNERERVRALEDEFRRESDGTGGSGRYGYSQVARVKEDEANQARARLSRMEQDITPQLTALEVQKNQVEADIQAQLNAFRKGLSNDFLTRLTALLELTRSSAPVWWVSSFIMLLVITIELLPVIVKTLSPIGPYDVKVGMLEEAEIELSKLERDTASEVATHYHSHLRVAEKKSYDFFFAIREALIEEKLNRNVADVRRAEGSEKVITIDELTVSVQDEVFTSTRG